MIQEPTINIPVLAAGNTKRRQFLTTLSIKSIRMLVEPIIQKKTTGAGLRENSHAARKIATLWDQRGEIESIKPIIIAIDQTCRFKALDEINHAGAGMLECPFSSFHDVCDGIQRIAALRFTLIKPTDMSANQWPVHLIETHGADDLAALTDHLRNQTTSKGRPAPVIKHDAAKWLTAILTDSSFLRQAVAVRKSSLAHRSGHLWAGSAMVKALTAILESGTLDGTSEEAREFAALWDRLPSAIPALGDYAEGHIKASQLRAESILTQAPTLQALATVLTKILTSPNLSADVCLAKLALFDWSIASQTINTNSRIALRAERTRRLLDLFGLEPPTEPPA
jgi:DNA-sulfur modification-associated